MQLEGSCHCGAVRFRLATKHPYPFNRCYCSICRKTAGGGGYAINLGGDYETFEVLAGADNVGIYQAEMPDANSGRTSPSPLRRNFCKTCASALWVWDARWPDLVHPFASAIDSALPAAPETTHLLLDAKPDWVAVEAGPNDQLFDGHSNESIAGWHQRLGLEG